MDEGKISFLILVASLAFIAGLMIGGVVISKKTDCVGVETLYPPPLNLTPDEKKLKEWGEQHDKKRLSS